MKLLYLLLPFLLLSLVQSQARELSPFSEKPEALVFPYSTGERLVYDVRYLGVSAGTAVMEVREKIKMRGREVYHVLSTARSNDFISLFYPVNNRVESYIDAEDLYSHRIKVNQRQGKRHREKMIDFNQPYHRAVQIKNNQSEIFEIPPMVQDSLSALYYFRTQPLVEPGYSTYIDVHESRKNWELEIKVLGREPVTTEVGTFNTVKVKALVRFEGLLMDKGDVYIWVTDDINRIPVKIKSKIKIGSISMVLTSNQGQSESPTSEKIKM